MHILINLGTLKLGGGQNVALNLLSGLEQIDSAGVEYSFVAAKGTILAEKLRQKNRPTILVSPNPMIRIVQEGLMWFKLHKHNIDIVYSVFGYASILSPIPQVCGVADSNLFYPEIDFWHEYHGWKKLVKRIIDRYRLNGYRRAAGLVFENEDMRKRFVAQIDKHKLTAFIRPSIVKSKAKAVSGLKIELQENSLVGLFLCGWQYNKNIMLIPELISTAHEAGLSLEIILTAPPDDSVICREFKDECKRYNVEKSVHIIGRVNKDELDNLYSYVDYVFLLSRLESFSNNIIEAWSNRKLLLISDLSWSRSICKDAAVYVDRDNVFGIIKALCQYAPCSEGYKTLVSAGLNELLKYPSIKERTEQEIEFVRQVYESTT